MNIQVTSVSKKAEKLWTAGAAVFVITQEDIRRSGALNIPDLLRIVPGVDVARVNASVWAISIRGINDVYGNKILVLIDGRAVYDPLFSGVYWDEIDVPAEDIARIEVIRGPGGTLWGTNAMNGVINIITKSSAKTQGGLIRIASGTTASGDGLAQYGGKLGESATYRVFEKYFDIDNFRLVSGKDGLDGWHSFHEGFRLDWNLGDADTLMVEGDLQQIAFGQVFSGIGLAGSTPTPETNSGVNRSTTGNMMARWTHQFARGGDISVQAYENHEHRSDLGQEILEDTGDFEFQDHMAVGSRHDLVWGLSARVSAIRTLPGAALAYVPPDRTDFLGSAFAQDEIVLTEALSLTLGSKFEHNGYTGFEFQPSAQLVWTPSERHTIWLSSGRAVHEPNMTDTALHAVASVFPVPGLAYGIATLTDTNGPRVERVNDYEAGYRAEIGSRFSIDLAAYANFYRDLRLGERLTPFVAFAPPRWSRKTGQR